MSPSRASTLVASAARISEVRCARPCRHAASAETLNRAAISRRLIPVARARSRTWCNRLPGTRKISLPSVLPGESKPVVYTAKLRRAQGGMARKPRVFVGAVAEGDNTAHDLGKYFLMFNGIDMKRAEGSSAPHRRATPAHLL